ncbi:MAG: hypothetical protein KY462_13045 [Actinobacteria bacterium]|nr:hypothetical protein [Actinomycetota bacterium]
MTSSTVRLPGNRRGALSLTGRVGMGLPAVNVVQERLERPPRNTSPRHQIRRQRDPARAWKS